MRNILARLVGKLALDRKILDCLSSHLSLTEEAIKIVRDFVTGCTGRTELCNRIGDVVYKVKCLEVKGDDLMKEAWALIIKSGTLHPLSIPLLSTLMNKLDDMLDTVNVLALEIERYLALPEDHSRTWNRLATYLNTTLQLCEEAVRTLRSSIAESMRLDDLTNNIAKVNNIEHDVDVLKNNILLELSKGAGEITCHELLHVRMIVQLVDNLADSAQDLANMLLTLYTMLPGS
ncbi:MAG: DUF47 family protein [Crenarchaeota archaeon]|nr:DUF47 family protein [Thermoproteota archaeon]